MHKLLSANNLSCRYAISGLIGLLGQWLFLPSTIFYLRPHYNMNENQNQDSSFGSGEVHDLDPIYNLVDRLLGGLGPLSVETVDDLLCLILVYRHSHTKALMTVSPIYSRFSMQIAPFCHLWDHNLWCHNCQSLVGSFCQPVQHKCWYVVLYFSSYPNF